MRHQAIFSESVWRQRDLQAASAVLRARGLTVHAVPAGGAGPPLRRRWTLMTPTRDTGTAALLKPPREDTRQARRPDRAPRPMRLLAGLIVAALAILGGWTVAQTRTVEELVVPPGVFSDHDSGIEQRVGDGKRAAQAAAAQHDASVLDRWDERNTRSPAEGAQHDAGINLRVEDRAADTGPCAPLAPGAAGWEARLRHGC